MKSLERMFYLTVILGLVSVMGYEFDFFTKHYAMLVKMNDQVFKFCGSPKV